MQTPQKKFHVKKGDEVKVIAGKFRGEKAKVVTVLRAKNRVVIELRALQDPEKKARRDELVGRRTVRKTATRQGGLVERSVSVHVSNLQLVKE